MTELVAGLIGLVAGATLGLICVHGSVKRAMYRICIDPSICQHIHDRRREDGDAMRREEYGFMA